MKAPKETNQRNSLEVRVIKDERVSSPGPLKTGALLVAPSLQHSSLLTWQAPISEKKAKNKHSGIISGNNLKLGTDQGVAPRESYNILITEAHVAEDIPQVIRTWKGIIQRVDDLELKQFQIFQLQTRWQGANKPLVASGRRPSGGGSGLSWNQAGQQKINW